MVIGKKKFKRWTIWDTDQKIGVKFASKKERGRMGLVEFEDEATGESKYIITCDKCLYTSDNERFFIYTGTGIYCPTCDPESEGYNG